MLRSAVCAAVLAFSTPTFVLANQGILLLAHNGAPEWNAQVKELTAKVDSRKPAEVAFGIPARSTIAVAVDRLGKRGVTEVIAVPFFLSAPIAPEDLTGYAVPVRIATAGGLDVVLAEIILRRAEETSHQPGGEVLLLVGHGGDDGGKRWAADITPTARRLNSTRRFGSVLTVGRADTLSPVERQNIRGILDRAVSPGRPILVVHLVPPAQDDQSLEQLVTGLSSYAVAKQGVLGDDRLVSWLAELAVISPH